MGSLPSLFIFPAQVGGAARHQQSGGLQNIGYIPAQVGGGGSVSSVQLLQPLHQILRRSGPPGCRRPLAAGKAGPQLAFIGVVAGDGPGIMVVVGIGKRIGQIMSELSQGIVVPEIPGFPPLQPNNAPVQKGAAVGIVVPPEEMAPEGAFQIGKGIAVRLDGAKEKGRLIAPGGKAPAIGQKRASQQVVTSFLHDNTSPKG